MADENIKALTQAISMLINKFDAVTTAQSSATQSQSLPLQNVNFDVFDDTKETFKCYKERLENFFMLKLDPTSRHDNQLKARILINSIGSKHYQLLSSLTAPVLPSTKNYSELIELLENHLCPAPNVYTEQHKFLCRIQNPEESIADFIAALRKLTITCQFICENENCRKPNANQFLRAQFIRGLYDTSIRESFYNRSF